jgi:hypothetical protein
MALHIDCIEINRRGILNIPAPNANKCSAPDRTHFEYEITVECRPVFDAQGFLIDHNDIHAAIEAAAISASCEEILTHLAQAAADALDVHGSQWRKFVLRIRPAFIEAPAWMTLRAVNGSPLGARRSRPAQSWLGSSRIPSELALHQKERD